MRSHQSLPEVRPEHSTRRDGALETKPRSRKVSKSTLKERVRFENSVVVGGGREVGRFSFLESGGNYSSNEGGKKKTEVGKIYIYIYRVYHIRFLKAAFPIMKKKKKKHNRIQNFPRSKHYHHLAPLHANNSAPTNYCYVQLHMTQVL